MIAPVTIKMCSGLHITIDADDVCCIEEVSPEGTTELAIAITYNTSGEDVIVCTMTPHDDIKAQLAAAMQNARHKMDREAGDEWKDGDDDAGI